MFVTIIRILQFPQVEEFMITGSSRYEYHKVVTGFEGNGIFYEPKFHIEVEIKFYKTELQEGYTFDVLKENVEKSTYPKFKLRLITIEGEYEDNNQGYKEIKDPHGIRRVTAEKHGFNEIHDWDYSYTFSKNNRLVRGTFGHNRRGEIVESRKVVTAIHV